GPAAASWVQRGDIVVVSFPIGSAHRAIKRVVGLPGDQIAIRQWSLTIAGQTIHLAGTPGIGATLPRLETVPAGALFLLGANAANSIDSRHFGAVPQTEVFGRVLLRAPPWAAWLRFGAAAGMAISALGVKPAHK